jgi:glycosyltransferase involved in cell wall biosynthesis
MDKISANCVYINGRYRTQSLTGVQRFAVETVAAMERIWPETKQRPSVLTPKYMRSRLETARNLNGFPVRQTGPLQSHAWEQAILPWASRDGLLVNLGNLGPIAARRQVVVIHDAAVFSRPEGYTRSFRFSYRLIQRLLTYTRAQIVTVSSFSRQELVRHLRIPESSIDVIYEGAEHIHASPASPQVLTRNQLEPNRYVLVVGSLARNKNLGVLGDASRMLAERAIPLVVTGTFDARIFCDSPLPLPQSAQYIGRVTDAELRALYEGACALLFPSSYEGFGLPVVEAMLCGCPVIAAESASLPEICGNAASLCNPMSASSFTAALIGLLDNSDLRESLRARGLKQVKAFTWENTARGLIDIIHRNIV